LRNAVSWLIEKGEKREKDSLMEKFSLRAGKNKELGEEGQSSVCGQILTALSKRKAEGIRTNVVQRSKKTGKGAIEILC